MEENLQLTEKGQKDYLLIQRAVNEDDQQAYAELMDRYYNSLHYTIYKMIGRKDTVEDLLLESFEKAFKNLKDYTPDHAFSTWLFRIAINNCIDYLRKKRKQDIMEAEISEDNLNKIVKRLASEDQSPEDQFIRKQRADFLKKCIEGLKPLYRVVIELRYLHENSYEEIAEKINLPIGTVKSHLFRGKKLLYKKLRRSVV